MRLQLISEIIEEQNTAILGKAPIAPSDGKQYAMKDGTWVEVVAGGDFPGTMDDITDGTTYVKTENNLTDALVSTIGTALQSETSHSDVLVDGDIGTTVQGYNANTVIDASYVHTDTNYTSAEASKLAGIEAGAEVNVQSDWNAVSGDAQILNKPTSFGLTQPQIMARTLGC
jgi:hypothetical protein